jgi:hypothetical protein
MNGEREEYILFASFVKYFKIKDEDGVRKSEVFLYVNFVSSRLMLTQKKPDH